MLNISFSSNYEQLALLFSVMHDGYISETHGSVPGTIILEVSIEYLRKRFSDPGDVIRIKLEHCTQYEYYDYREDRLITDLADIESKEIGIKSAYSTENRCNVCCDDGELRIMCECFSINLNSDRNISLQELVDEANGYWDAFGSRT